jgi:hypothetical protein
VGDHRVRRGARRGGRDRTEYAEGEPFQTALDNVVEMVDDAIERAFFDHGGEARSRLDPNG